MSEYQYKLERYTGSKTLHACTSCGKKEMKLYINNTTGEHLAMHVGRCNREDKCGYHYTPKQFFEDNPALQTTTDHYQPLPQIRWSKSNISSVSITTKPSTNFPTELFTQSLQTEKTVEQLAVCNSFVKYLISLFGTIVAAQLVSRYYIGTSGKRWKNAVVFWFISIYGNIRAAQVKLFDHAGYTAKYINFVGEEKKCTDWLHAIIKRDYEKDSNELPLWLQDYLKQDLKVSCFFGEHLINLPENKNKVIAICEAPKTAVIASAYLPQFVWIACGALSYLTAERCDILKGKSMVLFPDISLPQPGKPTTFEKWSQRALELTHIARFSVSDYLERNANDEERAQGLDLADYLIRFDHSEFAAAIGTPDLPVLCIDESVTIEPGGITYQFPESYLTGLVMETICLSDGKNLDILADSEGNFLTEKNQLVKRIESDYQKQFHPATLYSHPCLIHILKHKI